MLPRTAAALPEGAPAWRRLYCTLQSVLAGWGAALAWPAGTACFGLAPAHAATAVRSCGLALSHKHSTVLPLAESAKCAPVACQALYLLEFMCCGPHTHGAHASSLFCNIYVHHECQRWHAPYAHQAH